MTTVARVREEWHGEVPVAHVDGEVDTANAPEVGARLRDLLTNQSLGMIVDLSGTDYLDSAGINLLFQLGDELKARQQQLRVVVPPDTPIARMLTVTGLDRVHPVHRDLPEAVAAA
jgi:anti-anti-sigma factor